MVNQGSPDKPVSETSTLEIVSAFEWRLNFFHSMPTAATNSVKVSNHRIRNLGQAGCPNLWHVTLLISNEKPQPGKDIGRGGAACSPAPGTPGTSAETAP